MIEYKSLHDLNALLLQMLQVITKIAKWFWGVSECKSLMLENNLCFKKAMMCTQKLSGFADDNGKPRVLSKLPGGKSSKKRGTPKYWKAFKLQHEAKIGCPSFPIVKFDNFGSSETDY